MTKRNLLEELKQRFSAEVREKHIAYDWDAGWCYSYINHPLLMDNHDLNQKDDDEWQEFTNNWLYTHDDYLYHMSDVENGKLINQLGVWDSAMEEFEGMTAKEYATGLIDYINKYRVNNGYGPRTKCFYDAKLIELQDFCNKN